MVSALHQRNLQINANNKNNLSPLVIERNIANFSKSDSQRKYLRYFNGSVPDLASLPFPNFVLCFTKHRRSRVNIPYAMCYKSNCVNNPEEKHKEIKEESYNNL